LPPETDPDLLVGIGTADDAGVYRIGEGCALVQTTDIITPLVDDPFTFGRIAAANALSDVYAMGGKPVTAMNLAFFPACSLPGAVLQQILAGGAEAIREAGACLVGGHTVEDEQLKYGLSVTGLIDPERIVRNSTLQPGDRLILTKPLGMGIVSTAIKGEMAPPALIEEAVRWMCLLNREAAELMVACEVHAATDVTGFGLIGHAVEMARGAAVTIHLDLAAIPVLSGVQSLIADGMIPAGCYRNREYFANFVISKVSTDDALPLYDPQTSGGLLIGLAPDAADRFLTRAASQQLFAVEIGTVGSQGEAPIVID
jgi:selenide,water dikinase